jgi:hypothetical protein
VEEWVLTKTMRWQTDGVKADTYHFLFYFTQGSDEFTGTLLPAQAGGPESYCRGSIVSGKIQFQFVNVAIRPVTAFTACVFSSALPPGQRGLFCFSVAVVRTWKVASRIP